MYDALVRLGASTDRWLDGALAAAILMLGGAELALAAPIGTTLAIEVAAVETFGAFAVLIRRRRPLALAFAFSTACLVPGLLIGSRWVDAPSDSILLVTIILTYTVGANVGGIPAVAALVALCVGSSGGEFSDPIVLVVFTVPAWFAGTAMRSRTELSAHLAARAIELEQEREAYASEAIRYERVRVARDLHDIVAHNLSMIVVQAGAGRRALSSSPAIAAESLTNIEGGVLQAEREIAQLVDLLGGQSPASAQTGLRTIGDLVRRSSASGLAVSCQFSGDHDDASPELAQIAFHVAQEGITNALKYSPGAPVQVAVHAADGSLSVVVENGRSRALPTGLEATGGDHGLAGLRERVAVVGGDLMAGPTPGGGWRLAVEIPAS